MARLQDVTGSIRDGISDASGRAKERVQDAVESVEDAFESASAQGRKMARRAEKQLRRSMREADRISRDNVYWVALGALGIGVAIGYLIARDSRKSTLEKLADRIAG